MSLTLRRSMFSTLMLIMATACSATLSALPTPVEIWRGGDDGLTLRFAGALETAFRDSQNFSIASKNRKSALIVTIPTNVAWNLSNGRTRVTYSVEFSDHNGAAYGKSTGTCWEDRLEDCANEVLKKATQIQIERHL